MTGRRSIMDSVYWIFEAIVGLGILANVWIVLRSYAALPDRIPMHFDWRGRPDGWGPRWTLLLLLALSLVMQVVMGVVASAPVGGGLPAQRIPERALHETHLARLLLDVLRIEIAWLFAYMAWRIVGVAQGRATGLGIRFGVVVVGLSLLTPLAWLLLMRGGR